MYHSFRAVLRAGLVFFCAWVFLIPANPTEAAALGAAKSVQYPYGLRAMRSAQIIIKIAPDRAYDLIAIAAGDDVSPFMVRIAMVQMASGRVLPDSATRSPQPQSDRDIAGPRFIQVD